MLRKALVLMLAIGLVGGVVGAASALFTDTQSVTDNNFTAGSVDISTTPATELFDITAMAPGDVEYRALTVNNAGTLALRYDLTSIATDPGDKNLAGQLDLTIAGDDGIGACDAAGFATHGTVAYLTGDLGNIDGVTALTLDSDRVLAAGASEVLCLKIELPSSTGNTFQNATTVATLTFTAEQTDNN
jgi:predicted ribosomally synthesized peptide with SipW-like signal peptide